jgi:hypothetical protein
MIEFPYVVVLEGEELYTVMAPDDEQAAWSALSLSESLGCPLVDVYRREKRVSEQLAECFRHALRRIRRGRV